MRHPIYPNLEALLASETLSALESRRVAAVRVAPFATADSASGSAFLRVETEGVSGEARRYLVKRGSLASDWIMRATVDPGREALLWVEGLLDRLPSEVGQTILAAARDAKRRDAGGIDGISTEDGATGAGAE